MSDLNLNWGICLHPNKKKELAGYVLAQCAWRDLSLACVMMVKKGPPWKRVDAGYAAEVVFHGEHFWSTDPKPTALEAICDAFTVAEMGEFR